MDTICRFFTVLFVLFHFAQSFISEQTFAKRKWILVGKQYSRDTQSEIQNLNVNLHCCPIVGKCSWRPPDTQYLSWIHDGYHIFFMQMQILFFYLIVFYFIFCCYQWMLELFTLTEPWPAKVPTIPAVSKLERPMAYETFVVFLSFQYRVQTQHAGEHLGSHQPERTLRSKWTTECQCGLGEPLAESFWPCAYPDGHKKCRMGPHYLYLYFGGQRYMMCFLNMFNKDFLNAISAVLWWTLIGVGLY